MKRKKPLTKIEIAKSIDHDIRQRILTELIPNAKPATMGNVVFKALWNLYFVYVEPDTIPDKSCPVCWNNVYENWKGLMPQMEQCEREHKMLEML